MISTLIPCLENLKKNLNQITNMLKVAKVAIVANLIMGLLFLYSNFSLWSLVNAEYPYLINSHWSPLGISAPHYYVNSNGSLDIMQRVFSYFNFPFWIFFVALVVNLYFIYKISKEQNIR
jgi:hypothetical protein